MNLDRFRTGEETPSIPLTALVDVLFLMIIFLVLGANFDPVETVRLPEARGDPSTAASALRLELRADGVLWLEGRALSDSTVIATLEARAPHTVLLLPDARAEVGALFRWYDRIRQALDVPVQVGVQPPERR
ncbi:MAG: biopolymer transporter ExbD [SAR324 cluster bacterium]|nr:biopolymer transporter ExbD [SAR324 cluster bacterium]